MSGIFELLASRARERPDAVLFHRGGESVSNREAHDDASALAAQLRRDPVKILAAVVSDPYELHRWIWASQAASCTLALLPVVRDPDEVRACMAQVGAERLVTDVDDLAELAASTAGTTRGDLPSPSDGASSGESAGESRGAFLLQTSGTTGTGKWVAVRERQVMTVLEAMDDAGALRHAEDQVVYLTPALSHSYGLSTYFEYIKAGSAVVFPRGTSPLGPAGELRAPELGGRVTAIEGVSDFYAQLSRLLGRIKLPALRHVGFGGGKIDADALTRFREAFPTLTYSIRYGMTETPSIVSGMTFRPPYEDDWSCSGRVLPVWELRIVDGAGRPLGEGEEGEIQLRGPCLAWPYYGEQAAGDAFFSTGDLGVLTGGRLSIRGRKSLFIKHGGYRISPEEVEAVLRRFDSVSDVRVLMGEDGLTAEVVGEHGELPMQALREFAAERLPAYAVPKNLVRREEIPRTASGKIRRGPIPPPARLHVKTTNRTTHASIEEGT